MHYKRNPYINNIKLKSIASLSWIPEDTTDDILNFDVKGLAGQEEFVKERMLMNSPKSVWDPLPKLKIKSFST